MANHQTAKRRAADAADRRDVRHTDKRLNEEDNMDNSVADVFGEVISRYSRAQAIEDGILIDVSTTARETGITFPVAVSRAVWEAYVAVPPKVRLQDEAGRLWDVLSMLRFAIRASKGGSTLLYRLLVRNDNRRPKLVTLKSICGPGDDGEPVITIMKLDED